MNKSRDGNDSYVSTMTDDSGGTLYSSESNEDIAVTHVIIRALASALIDNPSFNGRRVSLPVWGIFGYYPRDTVEISVMTSPVDMLKICNVEKLSIREIANVLIEKSGEMKKRKSNLFGRVSSFLFGSDKDTFGSCVVFTSPSLDENEVQIDVAPMRYQSDVPNVVVVVGGVFYKRDPKNDVKKPMISISITMDFPGCKVSSCRVFAENVQKFAQNLLH